MKEISVNANNLPWEAAPNYPQGAERKVLRRDDKGNPLAILLKLPSGFELDDHSHVLAEQHYVLEGEYESMGERFSSGHFRSIPEHADHGPFRSSTGAVVLVIWKS